MGMQDSTLESHESLRPSQIVDLRLAASKMTGATRRAFQAEMTLKDCGGKPLVAETIFGWGRHTVEVGLAERTHGDQVSLGESAFSGRKPWEDTQPEAAEALSRGWLKHTRNKTQRSEPPWPIRDSRPNAALEALRAQGYREGPTAFAFYHGRGTQPDGFSVAQSGQSQTAKEDCRDRRHFRQY